MNLHLWHLRLIIVFTTQLKQQDEERRQREENEARMRGAQHNYNSAMRGGNFAQARNSKQDMENIAAKLK